MNILHSFIYKCDLFGMVAFGCVLCVIVQELYQEYCMYIYFNHMHLIKQDKNMQILTLKHMSESIHLWPLKKGNIVFGTVHKEKLREQIYKT